jgi:hypothetical protein
LLIPLIFLTFSSLGVGFFLQFHILFDQEPVIIPNFIKSLPLIVSLFGASLSLFLGVLIVKRWYLISFKISQIIYTLTNSAWYFDKITSYFIVIPFMKFGFDISYKLIDNQILEKFGPKFIFNSTSNLSNKLSCLHSGSISVYLMVFIFFVVCLFLKI